MRYHGAMRRISVFFDEPGFDDYPFDDPEFRESYTDLAVLLARKDVEFCIVRSMKTYLGSAQFSGGWRWDGKAFARIDEPFFLELVWNKEHFIPRGECPVLNVLELDMLCTDKWETYRTFPDLHPCTILLENDADVASALQKIVTEKVVLKPRDGERGIGVIIAQRSSLPGAIPSYPYLLQSFIDTSNGVPGLVEGLHDLRVIVINGDIACSYARTPPSGSMVANVAQGGKEIHVPIERIPQDLLAHIDTIDARMRRFAKRIYAVDMGRDFDGKWKIIELNAKPGAPSPKSPHYQRYQSLLADLLASA